MIKNIIGYKEVFYMHKHKLLLLAGIVISGINCVAHGMQDENLFNIDHKQLAAQSYNLFEDKVNDGYKNQLLPPFNSYCMQKSSIDCVQLVALMGQPFSDENEKQKRACKKNIIQEINNQKS